MVLLHPGAPPQPHDVWGAWSLEPLAVLGILVVSSLYVAGRISGRHRVSSRRDACFAAGVLVVAAAVLTPLDAMSSALASAHMVQHLLLVLVAAPLLALSAPGTTLMRGAPRGVRRSVGRARVRLRLTRRTTQLLRNPVLAWLLHLAALWFWHASVPYQAALDNEVVHDLEHATFLLTALLLWAVVVEAGRTGYTSPGLAVLLVFGTAMHNVFLSALLTFARTPWYPGYADSTEPWGLTQLADQQLAGAIMWVPGGLVYFGTAMTLLVLWLRSSEGGETVGRSQQPDQESDPQPDHEPVVS